MFFLQIKIFRECDIITSVPWNCKHKVVLGSVDTRNKNMFVQGILQCIHLKPEKVSSDHMDGFFTFYFPSQIWKDFNLMAKGKSVVISTRYYKHWLESSVGSKLAFCAHFLYSAWMWVWPYLGNIKGKMRLLRTIASPYPKLTWTHVPPYTPTFAERHCLQGLL